MFSNQTPNYGLPQYKQNDTLNVLSDFNGAMETIDSTMKTNELAAASAQSKADGADTKANNNATAIGDLQTAQGADRTDINTLTGAVNTINSLIGNGEPTTTDKTLIGAINELVASKASTTQFDAIQVNAEFFGYDIPDTSVSIKTALNAARDALKAYVESLNIYTIALDSIELGGVAVLPVTVYRFESKSGFETASHSAAFVDVQPNTIARDYVDMPASGDCGASQIIFDGSSFSGGDISNDTCVSKNISAIRFRMTKFSK